MSNQPNEQSSNSQPRQFLSQERQEEQALFLEPLYTRLTGRSFVESKSAIEFCRDLCAESGFTVKQEASTHRNIYVYCSREGLPDSLRNPKANPQRKRPSKRCDCRWRVVLYENNGLWEFRKSLNPAAGKHNHELMRPEEIERSWPKVVIDLICELARLRMTTQDIRTRVQAQFPNIHWNERRFYNRLSEERQKIKQRDTTERTHDLFQLWSKVCALTAGNEELSQFVKHELTALHQILIQTTQVDDSTLPDPAVISDDSAENKGETGSVEDGACTSSTRQLSKQNTNNALKGYIQVEIPRQTYYIKAHNQRLIQEGKLSRGQRRSRTSEDIDLGTPEPSKKLPRKGKNKESTLLPAEELSSENIFHCRNSYSNNRANNNTATPRINTAPIMRTNPSVHSPNHRHNPQMQSTSFVYAYDSNSMSLGSPLAGYVHTPFSNPYHMDTTHSSSSFNETEMQFQFDPSQTPMVRTSSQTSTAANSTSGGTTMNTTLQSHPMSKKSSLSHSVSMQQTVHSNYHSQPQPQPQQTTTQQAPQANPDIENDTTTPKAPLYSVNPSPILSNSATKQQVRQLPMYETTPKNIMPNSSAENQQQTTNYNHTLYMQQSHHRSDSNIMPMYNQSPSQQHQQVNDGSRMNISPHQ
ncbi:unnamed protein product [Rhizopus stolonifer]